MKKTQRKTTAPATGNVTHDDINTIVSKRLRFKALNAKQKEFNKSILDNQITFALGPAGTGKSYVSLFKALELLQMKTNQYNKIRIYTPIVDNDEPLGYLPGTAREKIEPYIKSSLSIIDKLIGKANRVKLEEMGIIEVDALAFMRGDNIDNTILVMEESQNMSTKQMKTLLTRLGDNSKFIISGDLEQSDRYDNFKQSGLFDAKNRFENTDDIGMVTFDESEIVRNPIIRKILNKYRVVREDIKAVEVENEKTIGEIIKKRSFWNFLG